MDWGWDPRRLGRARASPLPFATEGGLRDFGRYPGMSNPKMPPPPFAEGEQAFNPFDSRRGWFTWGGG